MDFRLVALWHGQTYPLMTAQDFVKLAYQSAFGAEHMMPGREQAARYLRDELESVPQRGGALFTPIGGGLCRLNLAAFSGSGLSADTVAGLFSCAAEGGDGDFEGKLDIISALAREGALGIPAREADAYISAYRQSGCPAVHHSDIYRREYSPAYRLVPLSAAARIRVFQAIDRRLANKHSMKLAIDGMSASGKTTFGGLIQRVYGANLFHMDDYFLPLERKTPERLSQPGGNVDYERFYDEIGRHGCDDRFSYRPFSCQSWSLCPPVDVSPNRLFITEGAYSLHPTLRDGYDIKAFFEIDPGTQSARIMKRNGAKMHRRFIDEWIPMENKYIAACGVKEICDIILSASDEDDFLRGCFGNLSEKNLI